MWKAHEKTVLKTELSQEESETLNNFLSRSVTEGTAQGYENGIMKWNDSLKTLSDICHPGLYIENVEGQQEKAKRVVLFMAYLYMSEGLRDEQIKRAVTSVSYMFEVAGKDTSFFKLTVISRGRAATSRSSEECRAYEENRSKNVILPICLDIVMGVREDYWV